MRVSMNRRTFVAGAAVVGVSALSSGRSDAGSTSTLRQRKSALDLPANDPVFAQYADAVKKMHDLPETDPRNWRKQAEIHADHCAHGTIDFLPWHRHYINEFEKICGALIGEPEFALPYWDWTHGRGKIPDPFFDLPHLNVEHWDDDGTYTSPNWGDINTIGIRAIDKGVGVQDDPQQGGAFTASNIQSILNETSFNRFYRRLETSPHNSGHVVVGFPASGQIGHIGSGLSPLDPLFWLHHCNVDRLWAQWQLAGNTTPPLSGAYDGQFVNASGQSIDVTADGATDFAALGYTYGPFGDPNELLAAVGIIDPVASRSWTASFAAANLVSDTAEPLAVAAARDVVADVGIPTSIPVSVPDLREQLAATSRVLDVDFPSFADLKGATPDTAMLSAFGRPKETPRRILAQLSDVRAKFERPPVVNVFVNCNYLGPETPYTDPHFAGSFAFFGQHGGHHGDSQEFLIDLTAAVRNIDLAGSEPVRVQLMPLTPGGGEPEGTIDVGEVRIIST